MPRPPRASRRIPAALPARKPMAMARRVSLFERRVEVRMAPAALDILLDVAQILSEGQLEANRFVGSTMVSVDITRAASRISDDCDEATVRRIAALLPADERSRERARRVAMTEARRRAGDLDHAEVDLKVRASGRHLHLDLDVEARRKS